MHLNLVAFPAEPLNHNNVIFSSKNFQGKTVICILESHAVTCPICTYTH